MTIDWQNVSTWRILVLDDEPDNLEVVAETLEFRGAEVLTAPDGKAGLEKLETFEPNLIMTDLSMPNMDGWEFRSRVKKHPKHDTTPILALSAHALIGDRERAIEAGFDGYLTKPIDIFSLLDDIRREAERTEAKPASASTSA
jgi:CheY-like chemotaxis protein